MPYRVRRGFLSGSAILQMSEESNWVDVDPGDLRESFYIVGKDWLESITAAFNRRLRVQDARIALYERRAASARKGRAKKRAPILTTVVHPVSTLLGEKHQVRELRGPCKGTWCQSAVDNGDLECQDGICLMAGWPKR